MSKSKRKPSPKVTIPTIEPLDPSAPITIVAGLGRCGTTLVMRMLQAGGYPTYYENPVWMENDIYSAAARQATSSAESIGIDRLSVHRGEAIKLVGDKRIPSGLPYRIVWLSRNRREQARSARKYAARMAEIRKQPAPRLNSVGRIMRLQAAQDRAARHRLDALERKGAEILHLRYETIVTSPMEAAEALAAFLGIEPAKAEAMAALVRTGDGACRDDFLEDEIRMAKAWGDDLAIVQPTRTG